MKTLMTVITTITVTIHQSQSLSHVLNLFSNLQLWLNSVLNFSQVQLSTS